MTKTSNLEVAETILQQLGGIHQLTAMIGAHSFMGSEKDRSLTFKWKADAKHGANAVTITLDPSDTYTVKFFKCRGYNISEVAELNDVYSDMLVEMFEEVTGLYLSL
jgi:hypothetical protein